MFLLGAGGLCPVIDIPVSEKKYFLTKPWNHGRQK